MSEKIQKEMQDKQRYEILREKTLNIYPAREDILPDEMSDDSIKQLTRINFKTAKLIFKKLATEFNLLDKTFENKDIELDFEWSRTNIEESLDKQKKSGHNYDDFAKLMTCFDEVVENAVGIEVHDDYKNNEYLNSIYVLSSAFHDEDSIYPVKLLVKEFQEYTNQKNKLYVAVTLEKINKKEAEVFGEGLDHINESYTSPLSASRDIIPHYPIKNILENIFIEDIQILKYIPNNFLSYEKREVKAEHISKEREKEPL